MLFRSKMVEYLDSVTLADLVEQQKERVAQAAKEGASAVLHDNRGHRPASDPKNEPVLT